MKNRAKCKLCDSIIESFHSYDRVACKCDEIMVDGGDAMYCGVKTSWDNFLRLDDKGNEIAVKYQDPHNKEGADDAAENAPKQITREELIEMLDTLVKNFEHLPEHAKLGPVNHYDLVSFMLVISNILKKE